MDRLQKGCLTLKLGEGYPKPMDCRTAALIKVNHLDHVQAKLFRSGKALAMPGSCRTSLIPADPVGIAVAVAILTNGGLVAFPTETVYGLGADATSPKAIAGIYSAKRRPRFNPLIAHLASIESAFREGIFSS